MEVTQISSIININNLKANYNFKDPRNKKIVNVEAVDNVSLSINEGETIGIAGESGCGKSTLAKLIYGLVAPPLTVVKGSVTYNLGDKETDIYKLSEEQLRRLRWETISYVPQGSMSVLNPTSRIKDIFLDVIKAHKNGLGKKEAEELIFKQLDSAGLSPEVASSYPHQLSGGMRQRAVIALATILNPKIILADEPTTALDVVVQRGILQLISKTQKQSKCTLIVVSHDMGVHAQIADRLVIMYAGKIVEYGPVKALFKEPMHSYTKFLFGSVPRIGSKTKKFNLGGMPPSLINPPKGCRFYSRCPSATNNCGLIEPSLIQVGDGHFAACHRIEVHYT